MSRSTRALAFALILPGLVAPLVTPAQAQPVEVASGQDLQAWQVLEQRRLEGDAAVQAYRDYVVTWSSSPLAVVAWSRLVALGQAEALIEGVHGAERQAVLAVRAAWRAQQATLQDDRVPEVRRLTLP